MAALNGKIYIVAGFGPGFAATNTLYEYDPATDTYTTKASLPSSEGNITAIGYNGKLYALGGSATFMHYVYDPGTDTWSNIADGLTANFQTPGVFGLNNQIFLVGGSNGFNPYPANQQTQIYDIASDTWSFGPVLNTPRFASSAGGAIGAKGYIAGGDDGNSGALHKVGGYTVSAAGVVGSSGATTNLPDVYLDSMESITTSISCGTPTDTPVVPTNTDTPVVPTNTATPVPTDTATATATATPVPATVTDTPIVTSTATLTATNTAIVPTVTPTDCPNPFVDISSDVFYGAIHYLYCRGVVNGTDSTHYSPAGTSTRAQFAKVVVLGFGLPLSTPATPSFTDVPTSYYAYVYIESGLHEGVLSGFDAASCAAHGATFPCYLPNIAITRGQLTKLVVNAAHYPLYTPTTPDFVDVPANNIFYTSIETAFHNSVINGYPDHTFRPNNNIRRDEMAQIVYEGIVHMP